MPKFAELTVQAREAILAGDTPRLSRLIDANFDLRQSICRIPRRQVQMVEVAREAGASAKFAGSGGAIIGTYADEATFQRLADGLSSIGCRTFKPRIVS